MILIELETGAERIFGSHSELAEAIRQGVVGTGARIYHRATEQWLPISVHPAFRNRPAPTLPPLPPLARKRWTFFDADHASSAHGLEPEAINGNGNGNGTSPAKAAGEAPPDVGRLRRAWRSATRYFRPNGKPPS